MKLRRLAVLAASLMLLPALPGCGPQKEDDGALHIGIAVYKGDDTYLSNMTTALQASTDAYCAETGARIYLTISNAQESQATQNGQLDRFLSLDYDVLCVNLVDRTDAGRVIDKARAANVPVVFFNREPVLEDLKIWSKAYYVGSDTRESATLQAEIVLELWSGARETLDLNGDGVVQYVMLEGESRHQDAIIRTEVAVQSLKDAGVPLERVDGGIADWDRSQAAVLTEGFFTDHYGQIDLVICNNDDMALGAADAVERLGIPFHNIVGIDGTPQGLEAVRSGRMLGTVVMDYTTHGDTIARMARVLAAGGDVRQIVELDADDSVRIPMQIFRTGDAPDGSTSREKSRVSSFCTTNLKF